MLQNAYFLLEEYCRAWPRKVIEDALFYYSPATN